jgi:hypothetical protein
MPLLYIGAAFAALAIGRVLYISLLLRRQAAFLAPRRPSCQPLLGDEKAPSSSPALDSPSLWFSRRRLGAYEPLAPVDPVPWRSGPSSPSPPSISTPTMPKHD